MKNSTNWPKSYCLISRDPGEDNLETGNEPETGIDIKEESDSEDDICFFSNLERNNDPAKLKVSLITT